MLERRLTRLYAAGRSEAADELARAVLRNERVERVAVDGDAVVVETRRFRGRHALVHDAHGKSVEGRGEYAFADLAIDRTFTTTTIPEAAKDRVDALVPADRSDDPEPTGAPTTRSAAEPATEPPSSLRSRLSSWLASARSLPFARLRHR